MDFGSDLGELELIEMASSIGFFEVFTGVDCFPLEKFPLDVPTSTLAFTFSAEVINDPLSNGDCSLRS